MISVVVPCYNEESTLKSLHDRLHEVLSEIGENHEIILVDDGSKDHTRKIISQICTEDDTVKFISFSRNFGKESALYAGLCNATGDYVAVMDADLQDPPHLLKEMYRILQESEEYDSVATYRTTRKGEPFLRSICAKAFYRISNHISDVKMVNGARDYRLMKRTMVDAIVAMKESNRFSKGLFSWVGFNTCWLPYENVERSAGKSKWSFRSLTKYAYGGIVNFSQVPLSVVSGLGIMMTMIAFVFLIIIVVRRLVFGDPVAGWASLISVIIFMSGCQLFSIGVLGQYIGKAYIETKNRPHYIIRETNIEEANRVN